MLGWVVWYTTGTDVCEWKFVVVETKRITQKIWGRRSIGVHDTLSPSSFNHLGRHDVRRPKQCVVHRVITFWAESCHSHHSHDRWSEVEHEQMYQLPAGIVWKRKLICKLIVGEKRARRLGLIAVILPHPPKKKGCNRKESCPRGERHLWNGMLYKRLAILSSSHQSPSTFLTAIQYCPVLPQQWFPSASFSVHFKNHNMCDFYLKISICK